MTQIEIRKAKAELHKSIVDIIVSFNPNDTEMDALWDYVKNLAEIEKSIDKIQQQAYNIDTVKEKGL